MFIVPLIQTFRKVDVRVLTIPVPAQEVITRDNVTVRVNAVVFYQIMDPNRAVNNVRNYNQATSQIAQTTLRSVLGEHELDDLLANREKINQTLQTIIDAQTAPWGIKVSVVEIMDVELPDTMKRAIAKQAEAERERRAKVIAAKGKFQASAKPRKRRGHEQKPDDSAIEIPADAGRGGGGEELDNAVPDTDRFALAVYRCVQAEERRLKPGMILE